MLVLNLHQGNEEVRNEDGHFGKHGLAVDRRRRLADVGYGEGRISGDADAIRALGKTVETGRDLFGVNEQWGDFVMEIKENSLPAYQYQRGAAQLLPSTAFFRKGTLSGTLWAKHPRDFKIGDWGCTVVRFRVIGKVSKTECLVEPTDQGSEVMLLRGLDMSKVTDGVEFVLQHPVWIDKTYDYTAASGGQKTVLVLERNDKKLKEFEAKLKVEDEAKRQAAVEQAKAKDEHEKAIEAAKWRTWD